MRDLVARAVELGGLPVDDALALLLPLFEQVRATHETGRVAPLRGLDALTVTDHRVGFDPARTSAPRVDRSALAAAADATASRALQVRRGAGVEHDLGSGVARRDEFDVTPHPGGGARIVAGWQRWEHLADTHDELTDIGSLGELLVALLCGLDLAVEADAEELATHRRNLFTLVDDLHPVVAGVAVAMVAPDRAERAQDLAEIVTRLSTYRDQPEDFDLDRVVAAGTAHRDRREAVLTHLRDRLFDLTRRNPLLHFRATARTLNLTQASVPLVLDVRSIRPAQLFTWGGATSAKLVAGRAVELGTVVRWEDAPYAAASLDALISAARRDRAEYGQDQLRLVVAFLRWHNVKDDPEVAIPSPLVLAPVTLGKQRGVRDSYRLQLVGTEAEVNPVLRHELRELYGFTLPETLDLADPNALEDLRTLIEQQARATQPGVTVATVDRPRIELIRSRAQTALQSYRRRRSSAARPTIGRRQYAYSYRHPGWSPLGVQIFRDRLAREPIPLSVELGDAPAPRSAAVEGGVVEQETFQLDTEGDTNPYSWEVDLCSVTLANFNYRTLTLVRDYEALLAEPVDNPAFDELFGAAPRDLPDSGTEIGPDDRYLVVPADGSQLTALAQARAADNFVVQGPPGTGKSQTITNLIADYLARGQRVLFVCQKRAALDVVHSRLRSRGLDEVCTLIHDSQGDKKAFVHDLRDTYERWLAAPDDLAEIEARRAGLVDRFVAARHEIAAYETALVADAGGLQVADVVDRLVDLRHAAWGDDLPPAAQVRLPTPAAWTTARPVVDRLVEALGRETGATTFAASPLRLLDPTVLDRPHADAEVADRAGGALRAARRVADLLGAGPAVEAGSTLAGVAEVARLVALFAEVPDDRRAGLLKPRSSVTRELTAEAGEQAQTRDAAVAAAAAAAGWQTPPDREQARSALETARRKESSFLRSFSGDWRRVRGLVAAGFTPPAGRPAPTTTEALALLVAAGDADERWAAARATAVTRWGHADLDALRDAVAAARRHTDAVAAWRDTLATDDDLLDAVLDLPDSLTALSQSLTGLLSGVDEVTVDDLVAGLTTLASPAGQAAVRAAGGPLRDLAAGAPTVLAALRHLDAEPDRVEYAVFAAALRAHRAHDPALDRLDGPRLADLLDRIAAAAPDLQRANAEVVTARLRARFRADIDHSARSVSGMSGPDRARKKTWSAGRRELEHEFGKTRAYKSIRQLASGDPGAVVAAMRPVWLMSPSSLSDTLPLLADFDVVVFDEASQIPVEEAVPALYRARQVIAVGDQMQLPPTQYFQSRTDPAGDDGDDGSVGVVLDADSFLAVSSARLPSTMLLWHYRSRYEALIQFSNAAFYDGRLATIPDRTVAAGAAGIAPVRVGEGPDRELVAATADAVLARSIALVRVEDGVYVQRTNPAEATLIAELVREFLARGGGETFGVVAFSEAQQSEIERALERLSAADAEFAARYEAELAREDDGQSVGLFVKNLENVQGDERDVIIMSVCYAAGPDGRMRMNFGPINNAGGEKRLNVIFSRAKRHMVLVSSIEPTAITNTYNDGANTLRGFLQYAGAVSDGDAAGAAAVLGGLRERRRDGSGPPAPGPAAGQLAAALTARGVDVARDVGQSDFRCDLALRAPGADAWSVAVLVDRAERLRAGTLDERRLVQPGALTTAGWRVEHVLATEWLARPEAVVDRLVAALAAAGGPAVPATTG